MASIGYRPHLSRVCRFNVRKANKCKGTRPANDGAGALSTSARAGSDEAIVTAAIYQVFGRVEPVGKNLTVCKPAAKIHAR